MNPQLFAGTSSINLFNIYYVGNSGGTITFDPTNQTLTLTSTITTIKSGAQIYTGDFGTVTFTTGPLTSGTILTSATFNGGTWAITTNGTDGLPDGVLLAGQFTRSANWRELGKSNNFLFSGNAGGANMHETSTWVSGTNTFNVSQGATVIPEPTTALLFGTGLLVIIGARARKLFVN